VQALQAVAMVANQVLDLTGLDTIALDSGYSDDLDALGAMLNDASGLSYDLASLNAQITVLFDLSTAPNSASALKQRLADIRSTVVQSYSYALRTQTLVKRCCAPLTISSSSSRTSTIS